MALCDWSSDVCSSDLPSPQGAAASGPEMPKAITNPINFIQFENLNTGMTPWFAFYCSLAANPPHARCDDDCSGVGLRWGCRRYWQIAGPHARCLLQLGSSKTQGICNCLPYCNVFPYLASPVSFRQFLWAEQGYSHWHQAIRPIETPPESSQG